MASNLRQAVDEAPMESYYCQTENMGIYLTGRVATLDRIGMFDFKDFQ